MIHSIKKIQTTNTWILAMIHNNGFFSSTELVFYTEENLHENAKYGDIQRISYAYTE